uniref:Uncharacterized protein n=1 Tax=Amorphochlora amoebiformis TaxID=1561963 RepID=A0A0H5BQY8_9EUKA|nr:hypothetical protein [Amorphochlora amoebiformis]
MMKFSIYSDSMKRSRIQIRNYIESIGYIIILDQKKIALLVYYFNLLVVNLKKFSFIGSFFIKKNPIAFISTCESNEAFILGNTSGHIVLIDVEKFKVIWRLKLKKYVYKTVIFYDLKKKLICLDTCNRIIIWNFPFSMYCLLKIKNISIKSMQYDFANNFLIIIDFYNNIRVFNIKKKSIVTIIKVIRNKQLNYMHKKLKKIFSYYNKLIIVLYPNFIVNFDFKKRKIGKRVNIKNRIKKSLILLKSINKKIYSCFIFQMQINRGLREIIIKNEEIIGKYNISINTNNYHSTYTIKFLKSQNTIFVSYPSIRYSLFKIKVNNKNYPFAKLLFNFCFVINICDFIIELTTRSNKKTLLSYIRRAKSNVTSIISNKTLIVLEYCNNVPKLSETYAYNYEFFIIMSMFKYNKIILHNYKTNKTQIVVVNKIDISFIGVIKSINNTKYLLAVAKNHFYIVSTKHFTFSIIYDTCLISEVNVIKHVRIPEFYSFSIKINYNTTLALLSYPERKHINRIIILKIPKIMKFVILKWMFSELSQADLSNDATSLIFFLFSNGKMIVYNYQFHKIIKLINFRTQLNIGITSFLKINSYFAFKKSDNCIILMNEKNNTIENNIITNFSLCCHIKDFKQFFLRNNLMLIYSEITKDKIAKNILQHDNSSILLKDKSIGHLMINLIKKAIYVKKILVLYKLISFIVKNCVKPLKMLDYVLINLKIKTQEEIVTIILLNHKLSRNFLFFILLLNSIIRKTSIYSINTIPKNKKTFLNFLILLNNTTAIRLTSSIVNIFHMSYIILFNQ